MQMPRVAIDIRPSTIGALLLTAGLAIGLQCMARATSGGSHRTAVIELGTVTAGSLGTPLVPPHTSALGHIIDPGDHPDARPWPHGMVIAPPPTADPINLFVPPGLPALVDNVLSALLAPASIVAS
jgi:hypothetical protein